MIWEIWESPKKLLELVVTFSHFNVTQTHCRSDAAGVFHRVKEGVRATIATKLYSGLQRLESLKSFVTKTGNSKPLQACNDGGSSMNSAVLSEPDDIFTQQEEQGRALKAFLCSRHGVEPVTLEFYLGAPRLSVPSFSLDTLYMWTVTETDM